LKRKKRHLKPRSNLKVSLKSKNLIYFLEEKKAKKDKNAPKRAISAFFFYQKTRREPLKTEQKELSNKELISKMSEEWKNLSEEQRQPYHRMAEQDKVRYENDKKQYEKTKGTASASKTSAAKPGKKPAKKAGEDHE
jgi:hypothetical protein